MGTESRRTGRWSPSPRLGGKLLPAQLPPGGQHWAVYVVFGSCGFSQAFDQLVGRLITLMGIGGEQRPNAGGWARGQEAISSTPPTLPFSLHVADQAMTSIKRTVTDRSAT